jgi:hypothetical protein
MALVKKSKIGPLHGESSRSTAAGKSSAPAATAAARARKPAGGNAIAADEANASARRTDTVAVTLAESSAQIADHVAFAWRLSHE